MFPRNFVAWRKFGPGKKQLEANIVPISKENRVSKLKPDVFEGKFTLEEIKILREIRNLILLF